MCTLILVRETNALRVAANRDERLDRPAGPPRRWSLGDRAAIAPVDLQAGGTWIGVNDQGVVAALTNRFGASGAIDAPSRGRWVPAMLEARSAAAAVDALRAHAVQENGFHLVVADLRDAFVAVHDGVRFDVSPLEPGTTIVTERSFDAAPTTREALIAREIERRGTGLEALAEILLLSDPHEPLEGVRVLEPRLGYGTRSSTLIEQTGAGLRFAFAERYPAETGFREFADLLDRPSSPPEPRR